MNNPQSKWFVRGDVDGFFGLFVDNLLQLMVIFFLCGSICGFPTELTVGRILPAAALSILIGILVILRVIPLEATLGILLWIGIVMTAQAFDEVPKQHSLAVAFGLIPALGGWLLLNIQKTFAVGELGWENVAARFGEQLHIEGVIALSQGFLLTSMVFAAMLVHIIERDFRKAAAWSLVAAGLSMVGLIHAFEITPFGVANKFGLMAAPQFAATYAIAAAFLFACHFIPNNNK